MKLDILSARNNEVEKMNEVFNVVFPYSKYSEDRIQSLSSKNTNEGNQNTSGKKNSKKFYSENTE